MRVGYFYYLFIIACLLTACQQKDSRHKAPAATKGILDLRRWDFNKQGTILLDGEWEFYWEQLYNPADFVNLKSDTVHWMKVPYSWNKYLKDARKIGGDGFATYRLKLLLDKPYKEGFSLRIPLISTASKVWVNGKQIYKSGKVSKNRLKALPQYKTDVVDFIPEKDQIEIVIQVSNYHYSEGGIRHPIRFGQESDIRNNRLRAIASEFWLEGSILIMALYHLGLFIIRKRDTSTLYFGCFCLLIALRIFITGEYTVNLFFEPNWWVLIRLEYLTFCLGSAGFMVFLHTIFHAVFPKKILFAILAVVGIFTSIVLFFSPHFFSSIIVYFQLFMVLTTTYSLYLIIRACMLKLSGSYAFLFGYLALFVTFLNDLLFANKFIHTGNYISIGLFIFIFSQAFLLTKRFSLAFSELEIANIKLSEANTIAEEQNEELWRLNSELDSFVYRTSHDLRAPIASVMGLINISKVETDITRIKYYLTLKEKSLKKLDGIIRDIIDYSKNKSMGLDITPIDFKAQVAEIFNNHDYMENASRIDKSIEWINQDVFCSDRKRIDIILNNLISNAIRYYNPYQENPFIKVKITSDHATAQIEVQDNGLGIAKEYQAKIFEMFFRISNSVDGSGVGLYVVKETIQKLGGEIVVESEANQGTIFHVKIPNLEYRMKVEETIVH